MLVSLAALAIGATPFEVGILAALFAALPLDPRRLCGKSLRPHRREAPDDLRRDRDRHRGSSCRSPSAESSDSSRARRSVGSGTSSSTSPIHNLIGGYGDGEARTRNFATFSLGRLDLRLPGPSRPASPSTAGISRRT
jgi:hypothetical protein